MHLKVLMFGWELPPFNSGGLGVACNGLANALTDNEIDVTFVLPYKLKLKPGKFKVVFADPAPTAKELISAYGKGSYLGFEPGGELWEAVMAYAKRAAEIAQNYDYDLVHAHDWLCIPAGLAAAGKVHKPLVSHVHATEFDRCGGIGVNQRVYDLEKTGVNGSTAAIAVSQFTKNLLVKQYGADSNRIEVVHNGINPSDYEQDVYELPLMALKGAGFKVVLYVGRITLQKGVDYLMQVARKVLDYDQKVIFVIAGSGDMERQIMNLAVSLGIADHVLFAGFVRGNQLAGLYRCADLFVMPSVSEPFGITALESVAHGIPAIISKQSGVSETLSHVLKTDFWDVDEMTNQMIAILHHGALQQTLKQNAKSEVKGLTWDKAAKKTVKVYKKALKRG